MTDTTPRAAQKPTNVDAETIEAIKDEQYAGARDKAGQVLKEGGHSVVVTPSENKRILRKIDLAILPIILVVYCLQSLDKTSLAYASVFGLIEHAHLVGDQYSWLGAIVYVAQLVWQPVVAYMLVKFPIGKFCAIMVFCCMFPSSASCCMNERPTHGRGDCSLRYDRRSRFRKLNGCTVPARVLRGVSRAHVHRDRTNVVPTLGTDEQECGMVFHGQSSCTHLSWLHSLIRRYSSASSTYSARC